MLRYTHWLGVPGGERVGRLLVSSLSSDTEFLLTASQSVTPINFRTRGLLGDLGEPETCNYAEKIIIVPYRGNSQLMNTELLQPSECQKKNIASKSNTFVVGLAIKKKKKKKNLG